MVNHKKKILENLANIDKKVKQCATTIDALHTTSNCPDTEIKHIQKSEDENTTEIKTKNAFNFKFRHYMINVLLSNPLPWKCTVMHRSVKTGNLIHGSFAVEIE